jgi:hypothetical protein
MVRAIYSAMTMPEFRRTSAPGITRPLTFGTSVPLPEEHIEEPAKDHQSGYAEEAPLHYRPRIPPEDVHETQEGVPPSTVPVNTRLLFLEPIRNWAVERCADYRPSYRNDKGTAPTPIAPLGKVLRIAS